MAWQYYRMFAGDFERDTGDLSLAEVGAYIRLLNHYYSTRKPLPNDYTKLYRICGAVSDRERLSVRHVIEVYFEAKMDSFSQRRVEQELLHQKAVTASQSTKRRNNGGNNGSSVVKQRNNLPVPVPDINLNPPTPLTKIEEPKTHGRLSYKSRQQERWEHNEAVVNQVQQWQQSKMAQGSIDSSAGQETRAGGRRFSFVDGEIKEIQ